MNDSCFVCLKNTTHRVCKTCKCVAHRKCWASFLRNTNKFECPGCRTSLEEVAPVAPTRVYYTRSTTSRDQVITTLSAMLTKYMRGGSVTLQEAEEIFDFVVANKRVFQRNDVFKFRKIASDKLCQLKKETPKFDADKYHQLMFGVKLGRSVN